MESGIRVIVLGVVLIISVIVIGAIALLIYFLVYKSSINKTITNQSSTVKHKKMPAPSSAAYTVIAIAIAAVMIGVWIDVKNTVSELSETCSRLDQQVRRLEARAGYLESEIESVADELQKEQSLFTRVDIDYGKPDYSNHCAKITVNAAPKSHTEDTQVSVRLGDSTVKLKKSGAGLYSGEIQVDFYKRYSDIALITVTEEGQTRSEVLDMNGDDIRVKYGAVVGERIGSNYYRYQSGELRINTWLNVGYDEDFFDDDSFKLTVKSGGGVIFEDFVSPGTEISCKAEKNTNGEIYISAVDKCGNTHICCVFSGVFTETGGDYDYLNVFGSERVVDASGNLIVEF